MPSSKAARKKQARLSFTPLPSSSPASKDYNRQIRDRAAAVTLEDTPRSSKYRRVHDDDSDLEVLPPDEGTAMPTPAASLQKPANVEEIDSDDEPIRPTQRAKTSSRAKTRSRQQKLDFSSSRDPDSFDSPVRLPSSSVRTRGSKPGIFSSQANGQAFDASSDDSDASDVLPSPRKLMAKSKSSRKGKEKEIVQEEDEDEDEIAVAPRRTPRVQEESDDDDDDMPTTAGKKPRSRRRRMSNDSFINDSPQPAPESDDDVIVVSQRSRKRTRQATESEDEDDLPKSPSKRRLKRPRQMTAEEKNDLDEDLDFLQPSSSDDESVNKPRGSQSAQKNARQQALEKLKRKRANQPPQVEEEQDQQDEQDGQDGELAGQDELYDDDDDMVPQVARARQMFSRDEDDDNFIDEEEEEGPLGVPEGVPLEFTRYASMKSKELFEYAVEWMVQKKINPAFRMDDDIYELTFKKLNDEVSGLADSKFTSAAWTPEFTLALKARPEIAYEPLDRNSAEHWMRDKCDACNRSGHPATYQIQFQGKPYHRETLEPVSGGDEDDEEGSESSSSGENDDNSDDEKYDWNAAGRQIARASTIWYVGKFCKSNAETGHLLFHWKKHLNGFVEDYLEAHGYCTAEQLVKRDRWNTKKRSKYANKVVDTMKSEGEVKQLWKMFRDNIDQARNSKQGRYAPDSP